MRKTLGVNISHHCSFAYFEDGVLKKYYEEDRFNKIKYFEPDSFLDYEYLVLNKFKDVIFDEVMFSSFDRGNILIEQPIIDNILKQLQYKKYIFDIDQHHIYHAVCGFYFSNFNEALAVVTDGGGERLFKFFQTKQSIYLINKKEIINFYKKASNKRYDFFNNFVDTEQTIKGPKGEDYVITNKLIAGLKYTRYTEQAGFKLNEEGQLMGLAAYKNPIAVQAQKESLEENITLIEKAITYSDCKNIILSGGYHLNCSNNFKLVKHFPKLNFFVDPIPYDGGTAVGAVQYYENYL
jgi:predicted NodU family carbamoyl transferase|tara:strand:- start:239 stop:1120 length:882 start_codon:yes stop_codon:yes gene_type:complete